MEAKGIRDFTKLFPLNYTLKFELIPVGKTAENLEKSGLLEQDRKRAEAYPRVKELLDEQHRRFLQKILSRCAFDWQPLADELQAFQKDRQNRKVLEAAQNQYRKIIVEEFKKDETFALLNKETPQKLFEQMRQNPETSSDDVETFARFACYFKGYQENRANIYSAEAQQTAAAYRAVNDNFTKYCGIVTVFAKIQRDFPELAAEIAQKTRTAIKGEALADMLTIGNYNRFLAQSGIDLLNSVIAEINYSVNQFRQQHPEVKSKELPFAPTLFKQILSDREHAFAIGEIKNDAELCSALKMFLGQSKDTVIHGENVEIFPALRRQLAMLSAEDDLYIDAAELNRISKRITDSWENLRDAAAEFAEKKFTRKADRERYCKQDVYHFSDIRAWQPVRRRPDSEPETVSVVEYWQDESASELFRKECELRPRITEVIGKSVDTPLRDREDDVAVIKDYLDAVQDILHLIKPFDVGAENGGDMDLQGCLTEFYEALSPVIPLYNHTRNYITRKPAEEAKLKLMFNNPVLANGWPDAQANSCVIFKNGCVYYLGILADGCRTCLSSMQRGVTGSLWEMMELRQIADPVKDLPNLMVIDGKTVRKTGRKIDGENKLLEEYKDKYLPENINRIRKCGSYSISNDKFSRDDLNAFIDFYKERIREYRACYNFHFKKSCDYSSWLDFTEDLKSQAYQLNFISISEEELWSFVDTGKIYLFKIWNKDFAEKSTGIPNKSTLYWRALFDERNLADVVFKLGGEAELFLREPVIKNPVKHRPGEKLVNKTVVIGIEQGKAIREAIPEEMYREIFLSVNGRLDAPLSPATAAHLKRYPRLDWMPGMGLAATANRTVIKDVKFELTKDRRFTERKYFFHVPIVANFKCSGKIKINDEVLRYLKDNPTVNLIGIDRGERNLIYVCCIDQQGRILWQKSYNIVGNVDYHRKLDLREKERDAARKNWRGIGNIKDLKAGYLSAVVHEIAMKMVEFNAIVFMEDLNFGFKRGRTKIEKQVYQKFERALIQKLNYLVFKNTPDWSAPGGVLNGYQLTPQLDSFAKLGRQCGWIFYVPAAYTSKIDPTTGFVNLFDTKVCTNAEARKEFLLKFDNIRYDAGHAAFAFDFDYRKFKTVQTDWRNQWTVYSASRRLVFDPKDRTQKEVDPTAIISEALKKRGIPVRDGMDLREEIRGIAPDKGNAGFFSDIFYAFERTLQMRNTSSDEDYIASPVLNRTGRFFVSSPADEELPRDADANGAFHIALKGLYLLRKKIDAGAKLEMSLPDWFEFVQSRHC